MFPNIRDIAGKKGIDLQCLYIPNDIFDKRAIKKHQIIFYNTAFIDAQIVTKKSEFSIKLKGYIIFDSDTLFEEALSELDKGEKREILMKNSIIKIEKDKLGKIKKQVNLILECSEFEKCRCAPRIGSWAGKSKNKLIYCWSAQHARGVVM